MERKSYQDSAAERELREAIAALRAEFEALRDETEKEAHRRAEAERVAEEAKANATEQERYEARVEELVREGYTQGQENAILRQRDYKPDEFEAYWEYVESCKVQAKKEVLGVESTPNRNIIEEEVI